LGGDETFDDSCAWSKHHLETRNIIFLTIRAFFWTSVPLLALLHWLDFGGTTVGSSNSNTSGEILPKKKALVLMIHLLYGA